jgi:DNA uptake protein ComE-like DNA-binding protein
MPPTPPPGDAPQAQPPSPPPSSSPPPAAPGAGAAPPPSGAAGGSINLNTVTFEQLREASLTVTQATRLLAHRERLGRFGSVDELDEVPGFPQEVVEDLKRRSTV